MPRRILKLVSKNLSRESSTHSPIHTFAVADIIWAMGSFCALNRKPFDAELLAKQFPPPYTTDSFIHAARALGFRIKRRDCESAELSKFNLPCLVVLFDPEPIKQDVGQPDAKAETEYISAQQIDAEAGTAKAAADEAISSRRYWSRKANPSRLGKC